jgi:hypothetical protein
MPNAIETLLKQNLHAVFGGREREKRQASIATLWEEDGVFIDPDGVHAGHAAIDEAASNLQRRFPDFVFSEIGAPDAFHGIGRLKWGFGLPGEAPKVTGIDVVVVKNERINALYTFLDPAAK